MEAGTAKRLAGDWVMAHLPDWPGLRVAHLVGGLATTPDDAPFPAYKDVDVHLVFAAGSPALRPSGPFMAIVEEEYAGLLLEAGVKSVRAYASPAAVLGNPEIAHHLTVASALHDPHGLLTGLTGPVRRGYARRRWVRARVAFERAGLAGALGMLPATTAGGVAGAFMVLGFSCTYACAALQVAALRPPRVGSQIATSRGCWPRWRARWPPLSAAGEPEVPPRPAPSRPRIAGRPALPRVVYWT